MPTLKQDADFAQHLSANIEIKIPKEILDLAIEWIALNLKPEAVFDEDVLITWAQSYDPDVIFDEEGLSDWAKKNNFVEKP